MSTITPAAVHGYAELHCLSNFSFQRGASSARVLFERAKLHGYTALAITADFARGRSILCQGRGSAANSAVCFALGITELDPSRMSMLFERFISRERNEPPDIDVDFEHERREEVIQYIYHRYGRARAALTAVASTYYFAGAVRDVAKALGMPPDQIKMLADCGGRWTDPPPTSRTSHRGGL